MKVYINGNVIINLIGNRSSNLYRRYFWVRNKIRFNIWNYILKKGIYWKFLYLINKCFEFSEFALDIIKYKKVNFKENLFFMLILTFEFLYDLLD